MIKSSNRLKRSKHASGRRGFTLVDLIMTTLIIGILAAISVPRFASFLSSARARSAATRIKVDLELARQTAITQSQSVSVTFDVSGGTYSIAGHKRLDRPSEAHLVQLGVAPYFSMFGEVTIAASNTLVFDRFGKPDGEASFEVVSGDSEVERVVIDQYTGRVSIE